MICPNCGVDVGASTFCPNCGSRMPDPQVRQTAPPVYSAAPVNTRTVVRPEDLPPQYRPLSAWAYWGLGLLFTVPIVGLVFLIVFSCSSANINRRSFARSYFCWMLLIGIVITVFLLAGGSLSFLETLSESIN